VRFMICGIIMPTMIGFTLELLLIFLASLISSFAPTRGTLSSFLLIRQYNSSWSCSNGLIINHSLLNGQIGIFLPENQEVLRARLRPTVKLNEFKQYNSDCIFSSI
jgi:hypothetical protein